MVYAVMGMLGFQNASRRNNAHNFVTTRLQGEQLWGAVTVADSSEFPPNTSTPSLILEFRFTTAAARDQFYTDIQTQLAGANGPIAGAWIAKHDCQHDEPVPVPCVETSRVTF